MKVKLLLPIFLLCITTISCVQNEHSEMEDSLIGGKGSVEGDMLKFDYNKLLKGVKLDTVNVGELYLPTGNIIVNQPFLYPGLEPCRQSVSPGYYKTAVVMKEGRVAFARVEFSSKKPVVWEMALSKEITQAQINNMKPGDYFGVPVDAATACILDERSLEYYFKVEKKEGYLDYPSPIDRDMKRQSGNHPLASGYGDWCIHNLGGSAKHQIFVFSTGWGDGVYPVYWGLSEEGEIVEILVDFLMVEELANG